MMVTKFQFCYALIVVVAAGAAECGILQKIYIVLIQIEEVKCIVYEMKDWNLAIMAKWG